MSGGKRTDREFSRAPAAAREVEVGAANRRLDREFHGGTVTIAITISAPVGASAMALEYEVPNGWEVLEASDGGQWDAVHRKVKWGPFFDDLSRELTFTVRPLMNGVSTDDFFGTVSIDGINRRIVQEQHGYRPAR